MTAVLTRTRPAIGSPEALAELEAIYQRDYHTCDCPWPHIERAWGGAVGIFREIRLCCMARALEQVMGVPEGTFYQTWDFTPSFEWDSAEIVREERPDGTVHEHARGEPPKWMLERMLAKGLTIKRGIV